jgi:hypothetical protein
MEWISAAAALALLKPTMPYGLAIRTICSHAHDGMIMARAERFICGDHEAYNCDIPREFWWARGEAALVQNWETGDFDTLIDHRFHFKAYGVSFLRSQIVNLIPKAEPTPASPPPVLPTTEYWDDLWVEMSRQLYVGDLIPKMQTDIEDAMKTWLAKREIVIADSILKSRARKLWQALNDDEK